MVWQVDLSGKCIIVTGGNRGIGLAISKQCAQAGAHVAILYKSSTDAPEVAKSIAEKYEVRCVAYKVDISDQKALAKLFKEIYHDVGPVGGLVCNAGINIIKPALETTKEDFEELFTTNVWGVYACAQAAALLWQEHGYENGRIVFISSAAATVAPNARAPASLYPATKSALTMLAKTLAMEWAAMGILVNIVSPGWTETDMTDRVSQNKELKLSIEGQTILKRFSTPDEQAGMVVFFLSDYSSYITGQQMIIDGGLVSM